MKISNLWTQRIARKAVGTLGLLGVLLFGCGGGGGGSDPATPVDSKPATVEEAMAEGVRDGLDGIFVYIDPGMAAPRKLADGLQDRSSREAANPDALFKIASISKMFVAVAATQMVVDGSLSLDDSVSDWLPDIAPRIENADAITVRLLLLHRSGVPDFDSQAGFSWQNSHTDIDKTLDYALDLPADFSPGLRYEYSNTNYLLLGKIMDATLGFSHRQFIQDRILTPLEMTDTYALLSEVNPDILARGYWDNVPTASRDYVIPGGSMISTTRDIAVFIRALADGELLDSEEQALYRSLFSGFGHSGWLPGYQSRAGYYADIDTVLIQFVSTTGGSSESVAGRVHSDILSVLRENR